MKKPRRAQWLIDTLWFKRWIFKHDFPIGKVCRKHSRRSMVSGSLCLIPCLLAIKLLFTADFLFDKIRSLHLRGVSHITHNGETLGVTLGVLRLRTLARERKTNNFIKLNCDKFFPGTMWRFDTWTIRIPGLCQKNSWQLSRW